MQQFIYIILTGIGAIIGVFVQNFLNRKSSVETKVQEIKEERYRSTLVYMRCYLEPENIRQFQMNDPVISNLKDKNEMRKHFQKKVIEFYYNSILFSSDDVLKKMRLFITNQSETHFLETAVAMRRDLWGNKTKLGVVDLSLED